MRVWIVLKTWLRVPVWSSGLLIAAPAWSDSLPNSPNYLSHSLEQTAINQGLMPEQISSSAKSFVQTKDTTNSQTTNSLAPLPPKEQDGTRTPKHGEKISQPKVLLKSDFTTSAQSNKASDLAPSPSFQTSLSSTNDFIEYEPLSVTTPEWSPFKPEWSSLQENTTDSRVAAESDTGTPQLLRSPAASTVSSPTGARVAQTDTGNPQPLQPPRSPAAPANPADPNSPSIIPNTPPPCNPDPELGCIRIQEIPQPPYPAARAPVLYLIPRVDFFRSSNVLSGVDPVNDGLVRPALTLLALPALGPDTYVVASVEGALNRYFDVTEFNYDELKFRAGIYQRLSPAMAVEVGWSNQQLFIASDDIFGFSRGTRFLNDHAVRLELSRRDQLAKNLSLSSFYQLRISFANPDDRSRIINVLFLSLNYDVTSNFQLGLDYQFASANFTKQSRTDLYHQVLGRITYNAFRNTQLSVYAGFSLGSSTEPTIDFNSFLLGVSLTINLAIF